MYVSRNYRHTDHLGRYRLGDLTGAGLSNGESGESWAGYDPGTSGRHWSVPKTGGYATWLDANLIPGYARLEGVHERLTALSDAGLIDWTSKGYPRLKRYLAASKGEAASDFLGDIQNVNNRSKEKIGYPTQKPLQLLHRIICASCNEGDMVLDPFCGCATACIAAEIEGRQWAGIDISPKAAELVQLRMKKELGMFFEGSCRTDIPRRTDLGGIPRYNNPQNKVALYGKQGGHCNGCKEHFETRHLETDHIVPRSKGGGDHLDNLQLLCGSCNRIKGNRPLEYLVSALRDKSLLVMIA